MVAYLQSLGAYLRTGTAAESTPAAGPLSAVSQQANNGQ